MDVLALLEKVSPILAHYPRPVQWLFIAAFTLFLGSFLAFGVGYGGAKRKRDGMTADGTLPSLISKARNPRAGVDAAKYVLESVVMTVKVASRARAADALKQTGEAEAQFVYTVFALDDVAANEFEEFAHTNVKGAQVARIAGSEPETVSERGPGSKSWTLGSPIAKGHRRTFVTGAKYSYLQDFDASRTVHDFELPPKDDAFCYPNGQDVIGELIIRIESDVPMEPPAEGDAILNDVVEKQMHRSTPASFESSSEGVSRYVTVGRWENVLQRQTAELKFRRRN